MAKQIINTDGRPKCKKHQRPRDEAVAVAKYIRVQPAKVRIMARNIIGQPIEKAINTLTFSPNKSAQVLLKVLNSAVANASSSDHSLVSDVDKLMVYRVYVDGGPTLKRWHPRSQGRAFAILKRTSHITVVVKEASK